MSRGRYRDLVAELGAAVVRAAVDDGVPVDPHALGARGLVVEAGVAAAEPEGEVDGRIRLDPVGGNRGEALLPHRRRIEGTGAKHEIVGQIRLEPQRPPVRVPDRIAVAVTVPVTASSSGPACRSAPHTATGRASRRRPVKEAT